MKTILVDAWNSFVRKDGINCDMKSLLDSFSNNKIILTNANEKELIEFGIVEMPYPVYSLAHSPNKTDPQYFNMMLDHFGLSSNEVVYFEHNIAAVKSAQSLNILSLHLSPEDSLTKLDQFLKTNLE